MQLQETDWQTEVAGNRIGPPSSWTPVAAQFGTQPAVTGMLYYSETGCFLIPDEATATHPAGMQSLMWGLGLAPAITDQAGEHALVELAGSQISIAADHAQALVGLAQDASGPAPQDPMPIPAQPQAGQTFDAQTAVDPSQQYPAAPYDAPGQGNPAAFEQPDPGQYPDAGAPTYTHPAGPAPAQAVPDGAAAPADPGYSFPGGVPGDDTANPANPYGGPATAAAVAGAIPPPPAGYVQMPESGTPAQQPQVTPVASPDPEQSDGNNSSLLKILIWVAIALAVIAIGYLLYSTVLSGSGAGPDLDGSVALASAVTHSLGS